MIAPGADADIVVYDPAGEGVITAKDQVCAADYAPYEGFRVQGHIHQVYLRGALRVDEGKVLDDCGGRYYPPGSLLSVSAGIYVLICIKS